MKITSVDLPGRLQKLLEERQIHANALARIDQTLAEIGAALGGKAKHERQAILQASPVASKPRGKRPKAKKFTVSAAASVLEFIKQHKSPTTADINKHWKDEGRVGSADNTLSLMVKAKKLKRMPLGQGIRGSKYSVA